MQSRVHGIGNTRGIEDKVAESASILSSVSPYNMDVFAASLAISKFFTLSDMVNKPQQFI